MGFKRPFDEEEFQEFPLKHPKQVDCGTKLISFTEIYPCYEPTRKADIPGEGEGMFCKFQLGDGLEHYSRNVASDLADKEFEISAPLSLSPEYFGFYFPRKSLVQFEDAYSPLLDGSPRRQVPIGLNHQAEVPVWDPQVMEKYSSGSDYVFDACGGKLVGGCVSLMPNSELSAHSGVKAGDGRKDCLCPDQGSVRCVRQHVNEARERVRETLGHEKFVHLGFCDMGEELSQKWTEEEERVFHEVVYSNPVSRGKNFWEHLSMVFPSRTKKEIVSYYFNVFMLQRRAVQNRSNFLDIDSDDDEWQGSNGGPFGVTKEDEDFAIESLVDQDVRIGHEDDSSDDDDDDDEGDSDDDGDAGIGGNTTQNDGGRNLLLEEECRSEFVVRHVGTFLGSDTENFDAQNVSCITFDCQPNIVNSFGSSDTEAAVQETSVKGERKEGLHGTDNGSTDGLGPGYLVELCDARFWDARYPMSPLKGVDLLPTRNMIEEIFGPCA